MPRWPAVLWPERGARPSTDLAVGGAVVLDGPAGLGAHGLEHLVVVAVLGQLVVAVEAQPGEDLGRDGTPAPLPPLVVLALLPRGQPRPRRHLPKMLPPPPHAATTTIHCPLTLELGNRLRCQPLALCRHGHGPGPGHGRSSSARYASSPPFRPLAHVLSHTCLFTGRKHSGASPGERS